MSSSLTFLLFKANKIMFLIQRLRLFFVFVAESRCTCHAGSHESRSEGAASDATGFRDLFSKNNSSLTSCLLFLTIHLSLLLVFHCSTCESILKATYFYLIFLPLMGHNETTMKMFSLTFTLLSLSLLAYLVYRAIIFNTRIHLMTSSNQFGRSRRRRRENVMCHEKRGHLLLMMMHRKCFAAKNHTHVRLLHSLSTRRWDPCVLDTHHQHSLEQNPLISFKCKSPDYNKSKVFFETYIDIIRKMRCEKEHP